MLCRCGVIALPPATPASGGGDLQMESREMCKVSSCNTAQTGYNQLQIRSKMESIGFFDVIPHPSYKAKTIKATSPLKMPEKLCLQWNDIKENVNSVFGKLRGV